MDNGAGSSRRSSAARYSASRRVVRSPHRRRSSVSLIEPGRLARKDRCSELSPIRSPTRPVAESDEVKRLRRVAELEVEREIWKSMVFCEGVNAEIFAFVDYLKTDLVTVLCRVCGVSTSGYYRWAERLAAGPSSTARDDAVVLEQIRAVHRASRGRYGEPRVTAQLARQGVVVNHKRVERLMARHGLVGRCGRKKVRTTVRDPAAVPAADLVERRFEQTTLDTLWVGDAT